MQEGSTLTLICETQGGEPLPRLTWKRGQILLDDVVEEVDPQNRVVRNYLKMPSLHRRDHDEVLSCLASNTNLTDPTITYININMVCKFLFLTSIQRMFWMFLAFSNFKKVFWALLDSSRLELWKVSVHLQKSTIFWWFCSQLYMLEHLQECTKKLKAFFCQSQSRKRKCYGIFTQKYGGKIWHHVRFKT